MKPSTKKTTSKRVSCRQRYKVERKVKEHHRKLRKAGKDGVPGAKLKKDLGVPNLHPFKDALLKSAEATRERIRVEKERQKDERRKLAEKLRCTNNMELLQVRATILASLMPLQKVAAKSGRAFDAKHGADAESDEEAGPVGGVKESSRAYFKEFKKVVDAADVVLEVLDARDPLGCRCTRVEQAVLAAGSRKKLVLVLNKIDLVPREVVEAWLVYLRNEFPTIAFKASTQNQKDHLSHRGGESLNTEGAGCRGASTLLKLLGNYCRNKNIKTGIRVGIVGFPNVGKSSIINSLKRSRACAVAPTPGFTKAMQEVVLDKHVKLLDSPGIVFAKNATDEELVLRNVVKLSSIADVMGPVEAILRRCNNEQIMQRYLIPKFSSSLEFLQHLARRHGRMKKGGIPDTDAAARILLQDWIDGRLSYYTMPPAVHAMPAHLSSTVVSELSKEFDIDALLHDEDQMLASLPSTKDCDKMVAMTASEIPLDNGEDEDEDEDDGSADEDSQGEGEEEEEMEGDDDDNEEEMEGDDDEEEEEEEMEVEEPVPIRGGKASQKGAAKPLSAIETSVKPRRDHVITAAPKAAPYEESSMQRNKAAKKNFKQQKRQAAKRGGNVDGDYDFGTDFVAVDE